MVSFMSILLRGRHRLDARGLYCREMHDATEAGATNAREGVRSIPGAKGPRDGAEETRWRTQETFGAATPGRRVLYSASWVLPCAAAGAVARTKHGTSGPREDGQPPSGGKS